MKSLPPRRVKQELDVSKVASCSVTPGLRNTSYHLPNKITHNTICPQKKEGRHIEGGEDVRKCEKEKREGPGVQKKKKGSVKSLGGVCVRKIKIKGKTKRRRRTVGHIRE